MPSHHWKYVPPFYRSVNLLSHSQHLQPLPSVEEDRSKLSYSSQHELFKLFNTPARSSLKIKLKCYENL